MSDAEAGWGFQRTRDTDGGEVTSNSNIVGAVVVPSQLLDCSKVPWRSHGHGMTIFVDLEVRDSLYLSIL